MAKIQLIKNTTKAHSIVTLFQTDKASKLTGLQPEELSYVKKLTDDGKDLICIQQLDQLHFYIPVSKSDNAADLLERLRGKGNEIQAAINKAGGNSVVIMNETEHPEWTLAVAEGAALGNYQFLKYFAKKEDKKKSLAHVYLADKNVKEKDAVELDNIVEATTLSRTLVNEPVSFLTAQQFSKEMEKAGKAAGFKTTVLQKKQIEQAKMGGLLAVNLGSIDPPTFTVMEYKPRGAKNKKPVVLVGKGVVFDTGGLSLKPTPGSMDEMKCDMAGGAAVVGAMYAIAKNNLPVHVIGIVPATDNRPGMNAVCPQDVITISDGTTVEVLNTDAEGRLILADALVYAKQFKPEICLDLATLTGAAVRAVGSYASAIMGTADQATMDKLAESGMHVWERTVQFPMWKEYGDEMKSDIADLKNLGGGNAGHITAGKFLEHFTDYPWIHIDIAGPAYINAQSSYRTKGGTAVGVRMLYQFIKSNYAGK
jgi:leucyl aminopeptidase